MGAPSNYFLFLRTYADNYIVGVHGQVFGVKFSAPVQCVALCILSIQMLGFGIPTLPFGSIDLFSSNLGLAAWVGALRTQQRQRKKKKKKKKSTRVDTTA